MLLEVITRVSSDTGIHLEQKRTSLIEIANQAAKEMYNELECNKIYREVTLVVPPDKVVSLPPFIGELRGMRIHTNELPFDLHSIAAPRYVANTIGYRFKNWRDLGESAVYTLPQVIAPLKIVPTDIETSPITLLIDGQTNKAARVQESILIDVPLKQTTNLFRPTINSIACATRDRHFHISITDINSNELAILYNTSTKTRYKVCDVSQVFWTIDTANTES